MSLTERLRKADWLNEFRALVLAGVVLILVFSVAEIVTVALGEQVVAEIRSNPTGPDEFTMNGRAMEHESTNVAIVDPTPGQMLWYLGTRLPSTIVLLAALFMLLRLVNRARRANPFSRDTVRDLRWLGVVLLIGGPLASLAESIATMGLSDGLVANTISGYWEVPIPWLFAGFGAMAIAQIVARGCAMREELDEVI